MGFCGLLPFCLSCCGLSFGLIWLRDCLRFCGLIVGNIEVRCCTCCEDSYDETLPQDVRRVNDSVREFYSPTNCVPPRPPTMEIIFFHGLQFGNYKDAYWKTWQSRAQPQDEEVIWPQAWLRETFQDARILSITYNTSAQAKIFSIHDLAVTLVQDIILHGADIGQSCPIYLVGHSLGGIVIKQLIITAFITRMRFRQGAPGKHLKIEKFLQNVGGFYFYATPHDGSNIANLGSYFPSMGPILKFLSTSVSERDRINEYFEAFLADLRSDIPVCAMVEQLPTTGDFWIMKFEAIIVTEVSARYGSRADAYFNTGADHITVCKPENRGDAPIQKLIEFIRESARYPRSVETPTPNPPLLGQFSDS